MRFASCWLVALCASVPAFPQRAASPQPLPFAYLKVIERVDRINQHPEIWHSAPRGTPWVKPSAGGTVRWRLLDWSRSQPHVLDPAGDKPVKRPKRASS
jgi:hypothetical protein